MENETPEERSQRLNQQSQWGLPIARNSSYIIYTPVETPEERKRRMNREYQRRSRAKYAPNISNPEETYKEPRRRFSAKRASNIISTTEGTPEETREERKRRLNREYQRRSRAKKSPIIKEKIEETTEERRRRLNREGQQRFRAKQQAERRQASAESQARLRASRTEEQRQQCRESEEYQANVQRVIPNIDNTNFSEDGFEQHSCGDMNLVCQFLPSTKFLGSPPMDMRERFHDAMAIVGNLGRPDLFITVACNPNWIEIQKNLFPGQRPVDRPDLVAKVFKIKLAALMEDIWKNYAFGIPIAFINTIEFEKSGLPRAHILIILGEQDKIEDPEIIDKIVCAELPDRETEPKLFEIVTKYMIHGPCGAQNLYAPCMENGKCTKNYPQEFRSETIANVDGYPLYRRRERTCVLIGNSVIDNTNVVPYNKFFSLKFNCHINVEACASIKSVKYIFNYDCENVAVSDHSQRINHERSHNIIRLDVHLPENTKTTLTAWFLLNENDNEATQYLYVEIPYRYVFDNKKWKKRQRGEEKAVPRMYSVNPEDEERFFLRLLLFHVRGAKSYEEMRTVDGKVYPTFKEAAICRHLLDDDQEWHRCLEEAALVQKPNELRQTFAIICALHRPKNALLLWETFSSDMIDDLKKDNIEFVARQMTLQDIEKILTIHGVNCATFNLPGPGQVLNFKHELDATGEAAEQE